MKWALGAAGMAVVAAISISVAAAQDPAPAVPQNAPPPPPPGANAPPVSPSDVASLAQQMGEQVRRLGKDVSTTLPASPAQENMTRDTNELALALDEFQKGLKQKSSAFQMRQGYSGLDQSWHHLRSQLAQPGAANFAMNRAMQGIDEVDTQIHKALGLPMLPPDYYGQASAPSGAADLKRLARTLGDRAAFLSATIQADAAALPSRAAFVKRSVDLVQATDAFQQATVQFQERQEVQNGFSAVSSIADPFEGELAAVPSLPPRVQQAWQAFASAELLVRQSLGLPTPPPNGVAGALEAAPGGGKPRVQALADDLLGRADAFLRQFAPTAGVVPEGGFFLADAQRLRDAAANFREDVARGLTASQLAYEFRDVDLSWQRLARRVIRVARGRTGPNIQLALSMGDTVSELHRVLAMPGYPPDLRNAGLPVVPDVGAQLPQQ